MKSDNELGNFFAVKTLKKQIANHKHRTASTITDMSNILIPFESKKKFEKVEVDEKEVQAVPKVAD